MRHFLRNDVASAQTISIIVAGCGGNGAALLTGLARLDHALAQTSDRRLFVTTFDDDRVSASNVGRQPFYTADVGRPKAVVLTERINHAYGLKWRAVEGRLDSSGFNGKVCLLVTCVDTAAGRRVIANAISSRKIKSTYWLDLGNRATDGQFVLGTARHEPKDWLKLGDEWLPTYLPTVVEQFPELMDKSIAEDDAPSCSVAEALERQSLFVNQTLASHALALLWELLGRGVITTAGGFVNLQSGLAMPIALPSRSTRLRKRKAKREGPAVQAV